MSVRIVHGANEGRFDFAGQKVKQIRHALRDAFNIPPDAEALLNGNCVQDNHIVEDGDNLEFVRTFGQKGGLHDFWSEREITELLGPDAIQNMSEMGISPCVEIVFTGKQVKEYISRSQFKGNEERRLSDLVVDFSSMTLTCGEHGPFEIDNSIIFRLLNRLNVRPCHYVHIDNLKRDVWNDEFVEDATVQRAARRLRKRLREMQLKGVDIKTNNGSWALLIGKNST